MWHFSFVFLTLFFTKSFWKAQLIYCRLLSLWGSNLILSEQTWSCCGKWFCANFSPGTKSLSAPVEVQFCQNKVFSQNLKTTRKLKQKVFEYIFRLAGKGELASPASAPYKWELEICWTKSTKKLQEIPTRNGSRSPGPRPGAQPRVIMEFVCFWGEVFPGTCQLAVGQHDHHLQQMSVDRRKVVRLCKRCHHFFQQKCQ